MCRLYYANSRPTSVVLKNAFSPLAGYKMAAKSSSHRSFMAASLLAFIFTLTNFLPAVAWNPHGHMVIAYLAYQDLTPETKERVAQLLRLNPYYDAWQKQIGPVKSQDELQMKIFLLASTWPDVLKGDKSYTADGTMGGFRPSGPNAAQNTGYNDKQLHMYWHFYDRAFSDDKTALPQTPVPNAETQTIAFRKVLSSNAPDELKSYDLTWLIHLVGDIHQPLHSVTRVNKQYPHGDSGGNLVKLKLADRPANLHAYWDIVLGGAGNPKDPPDPLPAIETASHLSTKAFKKTGRNLDVDRWIDESVEMARNSVYKPLGKGTGPFVLSEKYKHRTHQLAEKQCEVAAERLANILNNELK